TREWNGNGSLVEFVVSLNLHRRHLDSSQRAAVALDVLPLLEKEAKERQRAAGGGRRSKKAKGGSVPEKVPEAKSDDGEARKQTAKLMGTNSRYVNMAKRVKEADPELFEQVKAGKVKMPQAQQQIDQQKPSEDRPEPVPQQPEKPEV